MRCGGASGARVNKKNIVKTGLSPSTFSGSSLGSSGDIIQKRMTYAGLITSSGAGAINLSSFDTNLVQSASEWSSFATRYQSYRVHGMKVTFMALHPTVDPAATAHGVLYTSHSITSNGPSSNAQVLSGEHSIKKPTWKNLSTVVDWRVNPNAKLWTSTSSNIPVDNRFQVNYGSPSTFANSVNYYWYVIEFIVELRGTE